MQTSHELIDAMINSGILRTPRIIEAFKAIDRKYFVPEEFAENTYVDAPLPIGKNQTISQPSTVAFMLELLAPEEGDKVLDIGAGSGWTASLLCAIVGEKGSVLGLERVDELVEVGQSNLKQFDFDQCRIQKADEKLGVPGETFDAILVSASADEIPRQLFSQLKIGATLVIPVVNSIFRFKKISETQIETDEYRGFVFVPLIYK
ncbi:MAG: protein-L-isoaspartate O-methyltransferase [Campylobacterota bacterium]|nr:protein-L-isoaspartate O-methyltransferase [Campylobacterota bacterium]